MKCGIIAPTDVDAIDAWRRSRVYRVGDRWLYEVALEREFPGEGCQIIALMERDPCLSVDGARGLITQLRAEGASVYG